MSNLDRVVPVTISLKQSELAVLDRFAKSRETSRSDAVRALMEMGKIREKVDLDPLPVLDDTLCLHPDRDVTKKALNWLCACGMTSVDRGKNWMRP